jgi:hypothetical protein
VKQTDVPAGLHAAQEVQQSAGALGKLEAVGVFVEADSWASTPIMRIAGCRKRAISDTPAVRPPPKPSNGKS